MVTIKSRLRLRLKCHDTCSWMNIVIGFHHCHYSGTIVRPTLTCVHNFWHNLWQNCYLQIHGMAHLYKICIWQCKLSAYSSPLVFKKYTIKPTCESFISINARVYDKTMTNCFCMFYKKLLDGNYLKIWHDNSGFFLRWKRFRQLNLSQGVWFM